MTKIDVNEEKQNACIVLRKFENGDHSRTQYKNARLLNSKTELEKTNVCHNMMLHALATRKNSCDEN